MEPTILLELTPDGAQSLVELIDEQLRRCVLDDCAMCLEGRRAKLDLQFRLGLLMLGRSANPVPPDPYKPRGVGATLRLVEDGLRRAGLLK
jgi:hypothetical protein